MKKLLALVLAAAMVLSMSACGTSAAGSSEAWKFGGSGPLTGGAAIYGKGVANGAQIAVDEINAAGGINGAKIELKFEDDVADGETAVNAYNSLIDWGMDVMIGTVTTGACISMSAVAFKDRTFCITPSASSADVTADKDNMFQVCFTDPNQGVASADYIADKIKPASVAVIYRNDDAYSQGIRDTFVKEAAAKGLNVAYEGTFTEATSTDFSVQLTAAKEAGCDLIFLPIYYQPASVILNQSNQMGYAPVFFGVDGMDGILTMEGFDPKLAEGVMLLTPFAADSTDDLTVKFVKTYKEKYGEVPNQFAADGYDCIYVAKAAIEKAGVKPTDKREDICEKLIKAMTEIKVNGLTGQGMTWSANGEVAKGPAAVVIKDGVYVTP